MSGGFYTILGSILSAVIALIISNRNNYANNIIAHKVNELDKFKTLYGKFMSNCSKVKNICSNNDSGNLNELLKEIETIKFQLQLSIDDSFIEYKEFMTYFEKYAINIQGLASQELARHNINIINEEESKQKNINNENALKRMVFIYIFFENIWIERNLRDSKNDMSKIYSEAEEKYDEIFLGKMKNNESKSIKINDNNYVPIQAIGAYISQLKLEKSKNKDK